MDFTFEVLRISRKGIISLIQDFSLTELNTIPNGQRNHLAWNLGHLVATMQLLTYGLSGNPFTVEQWVIDRFRKGSTPSPISQKELDYLLKQMLDGPIQLQKDFESGLFKNFKAYPTSFGVTLTSIDDAITFNNIHDGLHYGVILAIRKQFVKPFNIKGFDVDDVFGKIDLKLMKHGFEFERTDFNRPWGGFFVIKESQSEAFMKMFFPNENCDDLTKGGKVSPKILVVAPNKRLSWQYHHRRSEVWRVIEGSVGVIRSDNNEEGNMIIFNTGDKIILKTGERHRLVGLNDFGIVAEIWQHTDENHPSNEEDIVRLQDDFGR